MPSRTKRWNDEHRQSAACCTCSCRIKIRRWVSLRSTHPTGSIAPYRVVNIVLRSSPLSGIDCTNSKYPTRPRLGHHLTNGTIPMQRPSVYQYSNEDVPGITVQSLRTEKFDISMRELASRCLKKSGE